MGVALVVAAQTDRPSELIKSAIAAAGGPEVLARYPAGRVEGKGTMTFAGATAEGTYEHTFHHPSRLRTVIRCEVKGQKWELVQIMNGEKVVQTLNGQPCTLGESGLRDLRLAALLNEVAQLTPLTSDKKFTLKPDKPPKGGLLVQVRGYPELRLDFERQTGHLAAISYRGVDPDSAKEAEFQMHFSEFLEVKKLTRPMRCKVTRDGKTIADLAVAKFTPLEKVDPRLFATSD